MVLRASIFRLFWMLLLLLGAGCSKDDPKSGENQMVSFAFLKTDNQDLLYDCNATIDDVSGQIALSVPFGTPLTSLTAHISVAPFASVSPASESELNYAQPVTFRVTAENGDSRTYRVTVSVLPNLRIIQQFALHKSQNSFLDRDYTAQIDPDLHTITLALPADLPIDRAIPTVTVPQGSTVSPPNGSVVNFNRPVPFLVTDSTGLTQEYLVTLTSTAGRASISKLQINGALCPLNASDTTFFYSLPETGVFTSTSTFTLNAEGSSLSAFRIEAKRIVAGEATYLSFFRAGARLTVTPLNRLDEPGPPVHLVLTSLPLVEIEVAGTIVNEPKIGCFVALIDPSGKTNGSQHYFPRHKAGIEIRGGMAQGAPKKSYSIEFRSPYSDEEVALGTELFGLRDDGDWILDAMYVDKARMRNRLCTDVWNQINSVPYAIMEPKARNGTRGRFVELLLNNTYQGLYCMTERIDRKQLNTDPEEGIIYKGTGWSTATEFISGAASYSNSSDSWSGWELEFRGNQYALASPAVKWEPLRDLIRFTVESSDDQFIAELPNRFDLNNLADYLLFMNVMGADDNTGKNSFFSFYNRTYSQFFITPWDLDGSWGRKWSGSKIDIRDGEFIGVTGIMRVDSRYCRPNAFFMRTLALNPGNFRQILKNRWALHRSGEFTVTRFSERLTAYRALFTESGAWAREQKQWPANLTGITLETEHTFMLNWISNRLLQVDRYVDAL